MLILRFTKLLHIQVYVSHSSLNLPIITEQSLLRCWMGDNLNCIKSKLLVCFEWFVMDIFWVGAQIILEIQCTSDFLLLLFLSWRENLTLCKHHIEMKIPQYFLCLLGRNNVQNPLECVNNFSNFNIKSCSRIAHWCMYVSCVWFTEHYYAIITKLFTLKYCSRKTVFCSCLFKYSATTKMWKEQSTEL